MMYIADGVSYPNSGGIDVTNLGIGPENWIQNVYVVPNYGASIVYHPGFGIRLVNTGVTHMSNNDVTGTLIPLAIVPNTGQTVQATFSSDDVWDAAAATGCVYIAPVGNGYVFHSTFTSDWCTAIIPNSNGLVIAGAASTVTGRLAPIMETKWIGGVIAQTAGQSGTGFLIADTSSIDNDLIGATVAGWDFGVNIAAGASHYTIAENSIGYYSPFAGSAFSQTNTIGINVGTGSGDWGNIHDNRLSGNASAAMAFAATGTNNRVHDNPGYNPVGIGTVTPGGSPWTFTPGPVETDLYLNGGTVSNVTLNGVTVCSASPCQVHLPPYQAAVVTYSATPTAVQSVH
jgi:hypothetical protein